MKKKFIYPSKKSIIFTNEIINIMSNRKADQHKLLQPDSFIDEIIKDTKETEGDVYDKAALLMYKLITTHGFASGNKRTGFITGLRFLRKNGGKIRAKTFKKADRIIKRIRQYNAKEIASWLRTGDIDETRLE